MATKYFFGMDVDRENVLCVIGSSDKDLEKAGADIVRVDGGVSGQGKKRISQHIMADMNMLWQKHMGRVPGASTYEEFRQTYSLISKTC